MRYIGLTGTLILILFSSGLAEAQTESSVTSVDADIVGLEAQAQAQDSQLSQQVQEISAVGGDLQETQTQVDGAIARSQDLSQQTDELEGVLASQQRGFAEAEEQYKSQARAAYKGDHVAGLVGILDSILSADKDSGALTQAQVR
ncbi:MAG: hypothetical protein WA982_17530, partial [Rubrobacteraceae bacterium]